MLTVNEIFHSIQGESTHAGERCVFVRLTACDLRCSWCDTPYAFHEGRKMSVDEVLDEVERYDCQTVEVTGGEPLLQKEVYPLMQALLDAGKTVLVETGGHDQLADVPAGVIKIMDVKCPGSGEAHRMDWANLDRLARARRSEVRDQGSRGLRIRAGRARASRAGRARSPRCCFLAGARRARRADAERMGARRSPARPRAAAGAQVHLGSPSTRGV